MDKRKKHEKYYIVDSGLYVHARWVPAYYMAATHTHSAAIRILNPADIHIMRYTPSRSVNNEPTGSIVVDRNVMVITHKHTI